MQLTCCWVEHVGLCVVNGVMIDAELMLKFWTRNQVFWIFSPLIATIGICYIIFHVIWKSHIDSEYERGSIRCNITPWLVRGALVIMRLVQTIAKTSYKRNAIAMDVS